MPPRLKGVLIGLAIAAALAVVIAYATRAPVHREAAAPPAPGVDVVPPIAEAAPPKPAAGSDLSLQSPPRDVRDVTPQGIPHVYMPEAATPPRAGQAERAIRIVNAAVTPRGQIAGAADPIQLYGVAFLDGNRICASASSERWPCGRRAYIALHNKVIGQTVECAPRPAADPPAADCFLGDLNLAMWLLGQGLARLAPNVADKDLIAVEASARKARLGLWLDPSESAPAASAQGK